MAPTRPSLGQIPTHGQMNGILLSLCVRLRCQEDSGCNRDTYSLCHLDNEDRSDPRVHRHTGRGGSGLICRAPDAVVVHVAWGAPAGSANSGRRPDPRGHSVRDVEAVVGADHRWRYWRRHRSARQSPSETEGPSRSASSCREPADVAVVTGRPIARASPPNHPCFHVR
jgi:hypothetical protein